jgi:hypothetical protein
MLARFPVLSHIKTVSKPLKREENLKNLEESHGHRCLLEEVVWFHISKDMS